MSRSTPTDTLRLTKAEQRALIDALNKEAETAEQQKNNRTHERMSFQAMAIHVTFSHPGGVNAKCLVTARNLSVGGLGFLHGGFVHTDTPVSLQLPTIFGDTRVVNGTVRSCRHVSGKVHEIGVKFTKDIDPYEFLEPTNTPTCSDASAVDASAIIGRMLVLESNPADSTLLKHQLRETELQIDAHPTFEDAQEDIAAGCFNLIIVGDSGLGPNGGADTIQAIRMQSYDGPVIAMTAESGPEWLGSVRHNGFTEVLLKPYDPAKLLVCISQQLAIGGTGVGVSGLIYSELATCAEILDLLKTYLGEVTDTLKQINTANEQGDTATVRQHCLSLKGTGRGYGYPRLSDAAREVVDNIDHEANSEHVSMAVRRLELIAQRLSSELIPAPAEEDEDDAAEAAASAETPTDAAA